MEEFGILSLIPPIVAIILALTTKDVIISLSKPSVCHAVATLKEGGFLTMDEDSFLHLTDVGREVAEKTYEKHCFFTRLLVEAGVEPKTAEQDACRMEHAISDDSFQKIKSGLKDK